MRFIIPSTIIKNTILINIYIYFTVRHYFRPCGLKDQTVLKDHIFWSKLIECKIEISISLTILEYIMPHRFGVYQILRSG